MIGKHRVGIQSEVRSPLWAGYTIGLCPRRAPVAVAGKGAKRKKWGISRSFLARPERFERSLRTSPDRAGQSRAAFLPQSPDIACFKPLCAALSRTTSDMARQRTLLSACYPGSSNQKHSDVAKIISQRTVESAKPPKEGRATRADGIVPGMQFITHAGGKKSFRLLARIHGKQVNLEIGDAAILSLADARAKAKGLLGAIANGEDPREAKRAAVKTAAKTVEVVATEFIKRYAKVHNKARTWAETERLIAGNITKTWGKRPITSIDQRDVIALLDAVTDRGSPVAANRVLAAGRKMFNWAIERGTDQDLAVRSRQGPDHGSLARSRARRFRTGVDPAGRRSARAGVRRLRQDPDLDRPAPRRGRRHDVGRTRPRSDDVDDPARADQERHRASGADRAVGAIDPRRPAAYRWLAIRVSPQPARPRSRATPRPRPRLMPVSPS